MVTAFHQYIAMVNHKKGKKNIHVIGICGVATSALAIAFKKKGWKVTGSDKGFYPPVSTALKDAEIDFYAGWHPEKMGRPDFIVAGGGGTSILNPEIIYAKENKIPLLSFAEAIGKYFIKKNSIVVAGTWGKTTVSAILSFILIKAKKNPSYFSGGLSLSHEAGAMSNSDWSVVEGDEYKAAIWDKKPKFDYYSPTHLLLTSISWDHADLYPSKISYMKAFHKLLAKFPSRGKIVACTDDKGVQKILGKKKVTSYGKTAGADYLYHNISHTKDGLTFSVKNKGNDYKIESPMLGRFNVENIVAAFAMAHEIGIPPKKIVDSIKKFKGIKRRFEKRYEGDVTVLDCHAPTAEKASSVIESIREVYDKKIYVIYEPNIGGRQKNTAAMYDDAFKLADEVIIPRLTKLKISDDDKPMEGDELVRAIKKTQPNTIYIEDDEKLVAYASGKAMKGDVIAFLGSHGFRGMIEALITSLRQ